MLVSPRTPGTSGISYPNASFRMSPISRCDSSRRLVLRLRYRTQIRDVSTASTTTTIVTTSAPIKTRLSDISIVPETEVLADETIWFTLVTLAM